MAQLRLIIYRSLGWRASSATGFQERVWMTRQLSREALAKMDVHLDLGMMNVALLDSIRRKDSEEE